MRRRISTTTANKKTWKAWPGGFDLGISDLDPFPDTKSCYKIEVSLA